MEILTCLMQRQNLRAKIVASGPLRNKFSVFATTPCRGLSLSSRACVCGKVKFLARVRAYWSFNVRTNIEAAAQSGYRLRLNSSGRSDLPGLLRTLGLRQTRCHRNNSAVAFACY
jgi:hypothetical protein